MSTQTTNEPQRPRAFQVTGQVWFADDIPASRIKVAAYDRDLRHEQLLGEAHTNRSGVYRIEYSDKQFINRERGTADLVVKALDTDGSVLVSSPVLFNAPQDAEIDLTIPLEKKVPPTLFERISTAVKPLLGKVKVEELEEDEEHQDLTFLSGETGFEERDLARFVLAHRLACLCIAREFWFALLGSSFFEYAEEASLKENLATVTNGLPTLDARAVRKALGASFNRREIPADLQERTDEWVEAYLELIARLALGDDKSPSFVKMALDHAGIDSADKQAKFARLFNEHKTLTPQLLAALEKDESFKDEEIADLRTSYRLADLTRGDFSVVKMLKEEFDIRQPEQIRTLAKRSEREWIELIERKHEAGDIVLPLGLSEPVGAMRLPEAQLYAKSLERQFREAFPTAAFAGGLERALSSGGTSGIRHAKSFERIIDRHPDFELLRTPIDEFLSKSIAGELRGLAKDESFRLELKAVQRVFKLAPTFEATDALLADRFHSAQMIYRLGESQFVRRYGKRAGFTPESARTAWNRAADTHAAVLTLIGDLAEFDSGILPGVLKSSHPDLAKFPNWKNLFQSGDICHCEHCRSVLSPAAYFTDLLMFLRDRASSKEDYSVRDILFERRPDLGYLELNCENALTTLPYVDVVCEVLEKAVDANEENDLILPVDFTEIPEDTSAAKTAVAAAFEAAFIDSENRGKAKISLGSDFSLVQIDPDDPDRWVVHGDEATYLLKKKTTPNFFAELFPNTKASAEELRAYPAYVNPRAYATLKGARYPFELPFDLFAEEVRAAFQKSSLQRWDLMRTFRGSASAEPNNPSEVEIAGEYFGISSDREPTDAPELSGEMRLILHPAATEEGQEEVWGETDIRVALTAFDSSGNPVSDSLRNVKYFLQKTGLEYDQLLAMLDLPFINPEGDIVIEHLDSSCDTNQKIIQGLTPTRLDRLDRIHRFLRLWRKLGDWGMWELDLAIRCPGIGHRNTDDEWLLDEDVLINLFYFERLRTRLGAKTTVEQLCALFGDLNTETRFTKPHKKRAEGLYQSLFLNKRLIKPLDPAFEVAAVDVALTTENISGHRPPILAALGISETELGVLTGLTRPLGHPSHGTAYITDDLTHANLSFLWRHAWLAKLLKLKVDEWATVLKLLQQDVAVKVDPTVEDPDGFAPRFARPKVALDFVESIDHLLNTGFTPDELNWLLAAERSAKAAVKEADAARFLRTLRTDLQAIRSEYDPAQYEFLDPPSDEDRLTALLTTLLQQLHRTEAEAQFFINTLKGEVIQEIAVPQETEEPSIPAGFTFPPTITDPPPHQNIQIRYEPVLRFAGRMTAEQRTALLTDPSLATVTSLPAYQQAIQRLFDVPGSSAAIRVLPSGFVFPAAITGGPNPIPIRYEPLVRFTGLMTDAKKDTLLNDPSLDEVSGITSYREAIEELFQAPRLALKFLDPVFTARLAELPEAVDFRTLSDAALVQRISYDAEERVLRLTGILSLADKTVLDKLSAEPSYRNAVNSLSTQPTLGGVPPEKLWLQDADLQFPLRNREEPANDNLNANLATAIEKGLEYLARMRSEGLVIQQAGAQLGLTEALTRRLFTEYAIIPPATDPETLLDHLTGAFTETTGVVDYNTLETTFDGWLWANRISTIWRKWKLTLAEWEGVRDLAVTAHLPVPALDFSQVPLNAAAEMAAIDSVLRTSRLLRFRASLPETQATLLEVLVKFAKRDDVDYDGAPAVFSADVQRLNEDWTASNVDALIAALDLDYPDNPGDPNDYLLAETWERLRRAFYFIESLNTDAETVSSFAAPAMGETNAKDLQALLLSKFGAETWLTLSAEIQDTLRERKRDALVAYLLAYQEPADPPSRKWENTNDLYAYYLLDVEMTACQLTSRIVQATGSVQLFVQRCFMGLEPYVKVEADGPDSDSAWRWWKWMRKYRVWEANRKVFLWPENWIEPELKKDRSPFFKDLENELLQNEINQYTTETAFANYLDKLDGVAQLEIAGFYQEDDGDNTILHVFGRTTGAEPHLYYYRRFDYRQWTPWEKVDLDIQGDYLIPAAVNKRLFLFWPVFTEVPDETKNSEPVPIPETDDQVAHVKKTWKKLRLQMAVSDYRQGKWSPKRVSKDFDESDSYDVEIVRKHYVFAPVDYSPIDDRFGIIYRGCSVDQNNEKPKAVMQGAFEIGGCSGVPEQASLLGNFYPAIWPEVDATGRRPSFLKWAELHSRGDGEDDLSLWNLLPSFIKEDNRIRLLDQTPGLFKVSPPWHRSYMDRLIANGISALHALDRIGALEITKRLPPPLPLGTWLPFFYSDKKRTFLVLWTLRVGESDRQLEIGEGIPGYYYPDIKRVFRYWSDQFEGEIRAWVADFDFTNLDAENRRIWEQRFSRLVPGETVPPFTDDEMRERAVPFFMRFVHYYLGAISYQLFRYRQFHFQNFYHPFVCDFAKLIHNPLQGIPGLMKRETQLKNTRFSFHATYRPTRKVASDIPLKFVPLDIGDLEALASRLEPAGDPVSEYVVTRLSAETQLSLANYQATGADAWLLIAQLINDLNQIIWNETVYDWSRFAGVSLRLETQELLARVPAGALLEGDLVRLKRLLLEDAFSAELRTNHGSHPIETVDFSPDGAYSPYNWELFFHAPLLIANALSKNQRFEEARDWYHFIFNPLGLETAVTGGSEMSKYWITKPFFETTHPQYVQQRIENILRMLWEERSDPGGLRTELENQVNDWRINPFEPHRIANYRTVAYQKTVVMKYLDNLISWGDYLFRQDSMESINEATQLYILAAEILGPRPKRVPPQAKPPLESFNELEQQLDAFANALVEVENLVPSPSGTGTYGDEALPMLYFCIPHNEKMLEYWDRVADRLYKIRNCMNIEGVVRQLALFEPPIDPGALVKAVAAGVDIGSALADLNAPLPLYRFNVLLQQANQVCNDVKGLGAALLSALEKKDAESLSLLRQGQEMGVLEAVTAVREKQIEEAKENLAGLEKNKELITIRREFYQNIEKINAKEQLHQDKLEEAFIAQQVAQAINIAASIAHVVPSFDLGISGFGGSPKAAVMFGGPNVGNSLQAVAGGHQLLANVANYHANKASINAGHGRRWDDWKLQEELANKELEQIDKSIAAAELRIAISEKELENHLTQIENAKAIDAFMRSKYTSEELYQWQVGQISDVYFQSYKLAYDLAKRAERCLRFELGLEDSTYIKFGYWDSLKKGLLSGEKLQLDLRRLESAYLEQNRREFELTKHVSLLQVDPLALVRLRETGRCFFTLPEELFDLDYPGHYFRRIKSVSLTLPCVSGPYTTISCTLRLLKNSIRINTTNGNNGYPRNTDDAGLPADDTRFVERNIPVKAIAASSGQNDSGLFELGFRDERYLPFEGAGAISEWSLELFSDLPTNNPDPANPDFGKPLRQFDYGSITDAVLHLKYTAREDAGSFKNAAVAHLRDYFCEDNASPSLLALNLRHDFAAQWNRFLHPTDTANGNIFELEMSPQLFPMRDAAKTLKVNRIYLFARCTDLADYGVELTIPPPPDNVISVDMTLVKSNELGGLHFHEEDMTEIEPAVQIVSTGLSLTWQFRVTPPSEGNLPEDLILVVGYQWE